MQKSDSPALPRARIRGVWTDKAGRFNAGLKVGPRIVFLKSFTVMEQAVGCVRAAERLRDERAAAGLPVTKPELLGLPASGKDLFTPDPPEVIAARRQKARDKRQHNRVLAYIDAHPELMQTIIRREIKRQREAAKVAASAPTSSDVAQEQAA